MRGHGFQPIPEVPFRCRICTRFEMERIHDPWHLRLAWHPLTTPVLLALTVVGVVLGQVLV